MDQEIRYVYVADASPVVAANSQIEESSRKSDAAMQQGANNSKAAMNQVAGSASAARVSLQQLQQMYQNVVAAQGENSASAQTLAAAIAEQTATVQANTVAQAANKAAASESAAQNTVLAVSHKEVEAASGASTAQIIRGTVAIDRLAGVSIGGGRALGTLATAFSAATAGQIALIAGAALAVGWILETIRAKEKEIQLTYDQIKANEGLVLSQQTGNLWTKTLAQSVHDENAAKEALKQKISELHIARSNEADAIAGENRAMKGAAAAQEDLTSKISLYVYALFHSTGTITENTEARLKAQKGLQDEAEHLMDLRAARGDSTEALKAEMRVMIEDKTILDQLIESIDRGTYAERQFADGHSALGRIRQKVAMDFAESHQKATKAALESAVAIEAEREGVTGLLSKTKEADANLKLLTETHKSGAAAIHQYNNEMANLEKQLEDAKAAADPLAGSFERQEVKIRAATEALIVHIQQMKQHTQAEMDLAHAIGLENLTALNNKRLQAELDYQEKVADMQMAGKANELERFAAERDRELAANQKYLRQLGFNDAEVQIRMIAFRELAERNYNAKVLDYNTKMEDQILNDDRAFQEKAEAESSKALAAAYKLKLEAERKFQHEVETLRKEITRQQGKLGASFELIDPVVAAQDVILMNRLGVTFQEVAKHFGVAAKSAKEYHDQLVALDKEQQNGATFGNEFKASLLAATNQMEHTRDAAQEMGQVMADAIKQMGSAIDSAFSAVIQGTDSFGGAMKKMTFDLIASMAQEWGAYYLAMGIADIFWNPARGAAELAAGAALEALAGVLHGLAAGAGKGSSSAGTSAAASGTAGSAAASSAISGANRQNNPVFVPINAGGLSQGPTTVVVRMDRQSGSDFLAGKDVVTGATMQRGGPGGHKPLVAQIARNSMKKAS